ncbi:ABC transporter permease subunit [Psychrilyobacter piezotolerans]|uniref:ABC transporter permease subunit n=2 Tax=Fusobacteriaceae TaxID=203492 RepID=A0ABX9KJF6_9FUSO|nr:ABC transporter permease subunit [Psychrilyobacter sp. S5]REI42186.1 ABC transporter permease subunit [Psychrilyobacter piezotolerans]
MIMLKKRILPVIVIAIVYILFFTFIINQVADVLDFSVIFQYKKQLIKAIGTTVFLSLAVLFASMIVGFLLFLMTESSNRYLKYLIIVYKEIVMGTPLLVLVFVVVYIIGVAFNISDKLMLGFTALTLYMSPYMTNVYEGAYNTIDENQFIVMDFYGFNLFQRYRYIILPQMIKSIIPGLINNLSSIVKGTSILSTIAISEIFYSVSVVSNRTYRYIEGYFVLWMVYLVITIPLSRLAKYYSKQWNQND